MISYEVQREGQQATVLFHGDLDIASVPNAKAQLGELLEQGCLEFLLDLSDIGHVDTTGLGFFVWMRKRVMEIKGQLILVGQNSHFRKLLEITGLRTLFTLCDDLSAARAQLASAAPSERS